MRRRWRCLLSYSATTTFLRTPPQKEEKAEKTPHYGRTWEEEMLAPSNEQGLFSGCQLVAHSMQPPVFLCISTEHIPRVWVTQLSLPPFFTNTPPLPPPFPLVSQATHTGYVFSCVFLTIILGVSPLVYIQRQTEAFIWERNYSTKSGVSKKNELGSLHLLCDLIIDTLCFSSDYVPWGPGWQ